MCLGLGVVKFGCCTDFHAAMFSHYREKKLEIANSTSVSSASSIIVRPHLYCDSQSSSISLFGEFQSKKHFSSGQSMHNWMSLTQSLNITNIISKTWKGMLGYITTPWFTTKSNALTWFQKLPLRIPFSQGRHPSTPFFLNIHDLYLL